jgi:hypothetical protein
MEEILMNSSAKLTSGLLAGVALGVVLFSGCTVNSTTDNDVDGGNTSSSGGSSSGSTGDDGGKEDAGELCAELKQDKEKAITSVACQTCLEQSCCTELKGCFNLPAPANPDDGDCDSFSDCVGDCLKNPGDSGSPDTCIENFCVAPDEVKTKWNEIVDCGSANCKVPCEL